MSDQWKWIFYSSSQTSFRFRILCQYLISKCMSLQTTKNQTISIINWHVVVFGWRCFHASNDLDSYQHKNEILVRNVCVAQLSRIRSHIKIHRRHIISTYVVQFISWFIIQREQKKWVTTGKKGMIGSSALVSIHHSQSACFCLYVSHQFIFWTAFRSTHYIIMMPPTITATGGKSLNVFLFSVCVFFVS